MFKIAPLFWINKKIDSTDFYIFLSLLHFCIRFNIYVNTISIFIHLIR